MAKVGFEKQWAARVLQCVESVSYRLKVNDTLSDLIWPERGIRQGDPISPYLLILCQEWFSMKLRKLQCEGRVQGIRVAREAPRINHLLFTDDCLIFIQAELMQLEYLKKLLGLYDKLAGQRINYNKSEDISSPNIDKYMLRLCGNLLGMKVADGIPKYLGASAGC